MIRFIWKILPYALLTLGILWVFVGAVTQLEDVPTAPSSLSVSKLLRMPPDNMPKWVQVDDGYLYWLESVEVFKERRTEGMKETEHVFVPLVDNDIVQLYENKNIRKKNPIPTCILVRFDRQTLRDHFPDYFDHPGELAQRPQPYKVSFSRREATPKFGVTGRVIERFKDDGFKDFVMAVPGSQPLSKEDALGMAVMGVGLSVVSVLWIAKRRKNKKRSQSGSDATIEGKRELA